MVVMLYTPCSEVVWRVLTTQSVHQFPLHFPSRASPCSITFQLDSTTPIRSITNLQYKAYFTSAFAYHATLSEMQLDPSYTRNKRFCLFNLSPADNGQSADEFMSTCSAVMLKVLLCIFYSSFKNGWCTKNKTSCFFLRVVTKWFFLISNFRRALNVVCLLLGNSPASE